MSLRSDIETAGSFPKVVLRIKPLQGGLKDVVVINNFLDYTFDTSILVPVDTFSFSYVAPDAEHIWSDYFREGDIVQLYGNDRTLATGLIDQVSVEVDPKNGERITITGRDLLGQFEDQDAVSIDSRWINAARASVRQVFTWLAKDTRISNLSVQRYVDPTPLPLFATQPGESKLAALSRYAEPVNTLFWSGPDGTLIFGRPNMAQPSKGEIIVSRQTRYANCLSMKAVFASATIPNVIIPLWLGQEGVQYRFAAQQALLNKAPGPRRLLSLGHRLPKSVIVSNPDATNPQGFADVNRLQSTGAGGANVLQGYAEREIARQNIRELTVQATMAGHFDGNGDPFRPDTLYTINFPRALGGPLEMYCYQAQYRLDEKMGSITNLFFTKKGTIVANVRVTDS